MQGSIAPLHLARIEYTHATGWRDPEGQTSRHPQTSPNTLVMVFGAPECAVAEDAWRELERRYPGSVFFGCSSAGEIDGPLIKDGTIIGVVAQFEKTLLVRASAPVSDPSGSFAAGASLATEILRQTVSQAITACNPDPAASLRALLVLSDGLNVNGTELLKGINSVLPPGVLTTGGLAADGPRFERTWVLDQLGAGANLAAVSGRVVAVGLAGSRLHASHGCKGGWDKFGPERRVTRSSGSVLYEIDGKPALALYKEYLGERASGLPATGLLFPLAIRSEADPEKVLVRTILKVDEATQSLTFAGDIPEGSYARLMKANFERLIQGAADAAQMGLDSLVAAQTRADGNPDHARELHAELHATADVATLALAVSCVGRRLVLGGRTEEELEAAMHVLPPRACQVGFYSYGEISPQAAGRCDLHNQTMTLTLLREH